MGRLCRCCRPLGLLIALTIAATSAPAQRVAPRWEAVAELSIGDERDGYAFTYVIDAAVSDDYLYVAEWLPLEVRAFDNKGQLVRRFGRKGSGPGEFQMVSGLGVRGDSLWVVDPALRRLTFFGPKGTVLGTVSVTIPSPDRFTLSEGIPLAVLPERTLLVTFSASSLFGDSVTNRGIPFVQASYHAVVLDTLAVWYPARPWPLRRDEPPGARGPPQPLDDRPLLSFAKDYTWWVTVQRAVEYDSVFRVGIRHVSNPHESWHSYSYVPRRVSQSLIDSLIRSRAKTSSAPVPDLRRSLYKPRHLPPVRRVHAARDGTIWLQREIGARDAEWHVLNQTGEIIATIELPAAARVLEADGDTVWVQVVGDLDVPRIVKYRLIRR